MHFAALYVENFDPASALATFSDRAAGAGAIVSFTGLVRDDDGVTALTLEAHPRATLMSMQAIVEDAASRFAITHSIALHRAGTMQRGEQIVFVAAAAAHRRAAFDAADFIMNQLKTNAVFWKKEHSATGDRWIEPTEADYAATQENSPCPE